MQEALGPSEKEDIQHLDEQLADLAQEIKQGKQDSGRLFYIGQQIFSLSQNNKIPDAVKEKLHAALRELQSQPFNEMPVSRVLAAKKEIDEALGK